MKAVEIFGKDLRPMMEWLKWYKEPEGYSHVYESFHYLDPIAPVDKAHTFLSQPMESDAEKFESWLNLVFKGQWILESLRAYEIRVYSLDKNVILRVGRKGTVNDFAIHCLRQGIKLELNEDFEI